jgi:hypothetical protein
VGAGQHRRRRHTRPDAAHDNLENLRTSKAPDAKNRENGEQRTFFAFFLKKSLDNKKMLCPQGFLPQANTLNQKSTLKYFRYKRFFTQ